MDDEEQETSETDMALVPGSIAKFGNPVTPWRFVSFVTYTTHRLIKTMADVTKYVDDIVDEKIIYDWQNTDVEGDMRREMRVLIEELEGTDG